MNQVAAYARVCCFFVGLSLTALVSHTALASDDPTKPASTAANAPRSAPFAKDRSRLAYVMAWRNSKDATEHTDALRLSTAFATELGVQASSPAFEVLEKFLDTELAASPGRFEAEAEPMTVIKQLLREDVNGFQRTLSPVLSEESYARYQQLLDSLRLRAK